MLYGTFFSCLSIYMRKHTNTVTGKALTVLAIWKEEYLYNEWRNKKGRNLYSCKYRRSSKGTDLV